jgi:phosphatidylinositol alpha-1,6-mannosyltransferase
MNQSILYLVPDLFGPPGGIARYCRMVCRALQEDGQHPTVLALRDQGGGCDEKTRSCLGDSYHPCQGSRTSFVRQALRAIIRRRPALILVGHPYFSPLGWALSRLTGTRWASFAYGIEAWKPLPLLRRWTLRQADQIIAISRFTARQAIRANQISPQKVRILHNCLDPQFERLAQFEKTPSDLSMLTVARMSLHEQYKGHDYVIQAMPALLERFPGLTFRIVGDGDDRARLEDLAVREGVARAVRFHGIVSEEDLRRLYAETSLFIMPSRGEGFGFVFLEAMAQGTPAIGGNVDATPEVIADGETGYLVNPTSVEAIVAAAARLLGDEALRRRMGQAAMRRVEQEFSFPQFRQRLASYLLELQ